MATTFKARFSNGVLTPLKSLALREGDEVTLTISEPVVPAPDWLEKTAGAWVGLVDGEVLKRDIYASRLVAGRPQSGL